MQNTTKQKEELINVRELFEKYLSYWRWFAVSLVVCLALGALYYLSTPMTFSFKAQVLVVDPNNEMSQMSVLNELSSMGGITSGIAKSTTNNEELVIRSGMIVERVVDKLKLHTTYRYRPRLRMTELYTETPYTVEADSALLHTIGREIYFTIDRTDKGYRIKGGEVDKLKRKTKFEVMAPSLPYTVKLKRGTMTISATDQTALADERVWVKIFNPENVTKTLSRYNFNTLISKTSDDIVITCTAGHEVLGKDMLNALISEYNLDAVNQLKQSAAFTSVFIDDRLTLLDDELSTVESELEKYKQRNELTDVTKDAEVFLETNSEYYNRLIETEIQLQLMKDIESYVRREENRYKMIPDIGLTDKGLIQVLSGYNQLVLYRSELLETSNESNPALQRLNAQLASSRESILAAMANSRRAMQTTRKELQLQNDIIKAKLLSLPQKEREYIDIQRQQQVKAGLYVFLLQKREEASLNMAIATNKARLLNRPDLQGVVKPRLMLVGLVAGLLGLLLPALFLFVRDLLQTTIVNRLDVEKLTQLPILTELARNGDFEHAFDHTDTDNTNAELFRLLRAKVQFVMEHPREKVILVTSTQPGEGKSFVSVNLAMNLSIMDKKVLLVGLDLRKPTVAKHLKLTQKEGISSYLSGGERDIHKLMCAIPGYPNLSVLPAGIIPPNANELLMKDRLDILFTELREEFDFIVLDTAPVGAVSDTYLVDRIADISLYVCRSEYSDRRNISFINRLAEEGTLKRVHIIINDVDFESKKNAYYKKYGYSYGYGYGNTPKGKV